MTIGSDDQERPGTSKEARRDLSRAEAAYRDRVKAARKELSRAEREAARLLSDARRELDQAEKRYQKAVAEVEKDLLAAQNNLILSYGSAVRLYDDRLETPHGVAPLSHGIEAKVQASGRRTEKRDTRQLYLLLETPLFDSVVSCRPNDQPLVRQLAATINTAAKSAGALIADHEENVAASRRRLEVVRTDRSSIADAELRLSQINAETAARVDLARRVVADAEANTGEIVARGAALRAVDPSARIREAKPPRPGPFRFLHPLRTRSGIWWRLRSRKTKTGLIAALLILLVLALGAITGSDPESDTAADRAVIDIAPPPAARRLDKKPAGVSPRTRTYVVASIVDGDTLEMDNGPIVRLAQIDAPERKGECFGRGATATLRSLLPPGTRVRLRFDPKLDQRDRFGRSLAYVFKGSELIQRSLINRGAAAPWFYRGERGRYAGSLASAAQRARTRARGLWQGCAATALNTDLSISTRKPPPPPPPPPATPPSPTPPSPPATPELPPATSCAAGYDPCLPITGDLDCADVEAMGLAPVSVAGDDPYRLDADGDGVGCED